MSHKIREKLTFFTDLLPDLLIVESRALIKWTTWTTGTSNLRLSGTKLWRLQWSICPHIVTCNVVHRISNLRLRNISNLLTIIRTLNVQFWAFRHPFEFVTEDSFSANIGKCKKIQSAKSAKCDVFCSHLFQGHMPIWHFLCRYRTVRQKLEKPHNAVKFRQIWLKHKKHDWNRMGFRRLCSERRHYKI